MIFSLSVPVITDTAHALAAFQNLTSPEPQRAVLAPLLSPSRRGLFTIMVRQSFAELALALLPYVADCSLGAEEAASDPGHTDPEGPGSPDVMTIDLRVPAGLGENAPWALRRQLEQAVAMTALARVVTASGTDNAHAIALADTFAGQASAALASLARTLATPPAPFVRRL